MEQSQGPRQAFKKKIATTTMQSIYVIVLCSLVLFAGLLCAAKQPNIILILTDDQDAVYDSSKFMPFLQEFLIEQVSLMKIISSCTWCTILPEPIL
jgi:hypothetical protein